MNSKNQFVPYELAVKLKDLGFDEECLGYYGIRDDGSINILNHCQWSNYGFDHEDTGIPTILLSQAFDWFRRKDIRFCIQDVSELNYDMFILTIEHLNNDTSMWDMYCEFKEHNGKSENIYPTYC